MAKNKNLPVILEGSCHVNRDVEDVFDYVANLENYPFWFPGIAQMRAMGPTDGPDVGARYAEIAHLPGGKEERVEAEIVAFDRPRSFAMDASLAPALPRFEYIFEQTGPHATRFTWRCSRRGRSPAAALAQWLMPLILKPRLNTALDNLKRILEAPPGSNMRASVTRRFGDAGEVTTYDPSFARPKPGKGEVLIRQIASSLNHIDVARCAGYGRKLLALRGVKGFPQILGNDVFGIIEACGPGVADFEIGTHVFGAKPPAVAGAFAEYVAVDASHLIKAPNDGDPDLLAGAPYVFLTAWAGLVTAGGLSQSNAASKRVFVQGGAGAVGSMAVQLAKHWGATVALSCHTRDVEYARSLGADRVFDFTCEEYAEALSEYDIALCCADPGEADKMLSILKKNGDAVYASVVHPTLTLGDELGPLRGLLRARKLRKDAARASGRRVEWALFSPSADGLRELADMIARDVLKLRVDRRVSLDQLADAHTVQAAGPQGKIIIQISDIETASPRRSAGSELGRVT